MSRSTTRAVLPALLGVALLFAVAPAAAQGGDFWEEVRQPGQAAYRAHVRRAEVALSARRTADALDATQVAIAALPNQPEAHALRAIALAESGDVPGMASEATLALSLDEGAYDDPVWGARVALLLATAGENELAARVLRRTLATMAPTHMRRQLYTLLGDVAQSLGPAHLDEAARAYRVALKSGPADSRTVLGLGLALHRRGQQAEALLLLRRAVAPGPLDQLIATLPVPRSERAARTGVLAEVAGDATAARAAYLDAQEGTLYGEWVAAARARVAGPAAGTAPTRRPGRRAPR